MHFLPDRVNNDAPIQHTEQRSAFKAQGGATTIYNTSQVPLTGTNGASNKSLSHFGKSEPMPSEIETQRQTLASNVGQPRQERNPEFNLMNNSSGMVDPRSHVAEMRARSPGVVPASHQVLSAKAFDEQPHEVILESYNDLVNFQATNQWRNGQTITFKSRGKKLRDGAHTQKQQSP